MAYSPLGGRCMVFPGTLRSGRDISGYSSYKSTPWPGARQTLFRGNQHFDVSLVADAGQLRFEPTRVSYAAFRVIDKTEECGAVRVGRVALAIDYELISDFPRADPRPGLL